MDRTLNFDSYELRKAGWRKDLGPDYVENIFSRPLKKNSDQRKLIVVSVYFQFLSDKINQNSNFDKLSSGKMAFFCITVNFIIKKLKSKPLAVSSSQEVFQREEIFSTYSRP